MATKKLKQVPEADVDAVKATAQRMVTDNRDLMTMYQRYREIYFMENIEQPKNQGVDKDDWKLTASPGGRNAVTGMKRLLDTSEVHITIKAKGDKHPKSDDIENGLKKILSVSGEYRRARIDKDAILSAILYGPVVLGAESVDDMLAVQKKPMYKKRLEAIRKRTPVLVRAINAEESYQDWGELGMLQHLREYNMSGLELKERWGIDTQGDQRKVVKVHDFLDLEKRVVWADNVKNAIFAKYHSMDSMNVVARYAGGSSLFNEAKYQLQPFLYAHAKGEWDKRENLWFTYIFTALYMQGLPGPLLIVDPDSVNGQTEINIDFTGGVRKIIGKAQPANFPVVDRDAMEIKKMLDEVGNDSMIYKQTLGQNLSGSTFSGLAMLSSAGQLPLQDPKEAIQQAFKDIFEHILCRIKYEGIENDLIPATDIPDEYEIDVRLEPRLPQDNLRNSQIAQGLGDLVSDEWKHENLLQVGDTKAMMKQVIKEQMLKAFTGRMMQDPNIMGKFMEKALGNLMGPPASVDPTPPDQAMPPSEQLPPPEAAMSPEMMGAQGQPNMEQMPQTGPMIPPQERM
jgi:hypothetical protein